MKRWLLRLGVLALLLALLAAGVTAWSYWPYSERVEIRGNTKVTSSRTVTLLPVGKWGFDSAERKMGCFAESTIRRTKIGFLMVRETTENELPE